MSLLLTGAGMVAKAGLNYAAQQKAKKQADKALKGLRFANKKALTGFDDLQSFVSNAPKLEIDRSRHDKIVDMALGESLSAQGRAAGDEQRKDSIRSTSADAFATAGNVAGSGADLLAAVGEIQESENAAMREADIASLKERERTVRLAKDRLMTETRNRALFNDSADLMEFNDAKLRRADQARLMQDRLDFERELELSELAQEAAVGSGQAAMLSGFGDLAGQAGELGFDLYTNSLDNADIKAELTAGQDMDVDLSDLDLSFMNDDVADDDLDFLNGY